MWNIKWLGGGRADRVGWPKGGSVGRATIIHESYRPKVHDQTGINTSKIINFYSFGLTWRLAVHFYFITYFMSWAAGCMARGVPTGPTSWWMNSEASQCMQNVKIYIIQESGNRADWNDGGSKMIRTPHFLQMVLHLKTVWLNSMIK